jgi:hypothetical protein
LGYNKLAPQPDWQTLGFESLAGTQHQNKGDTVNYYEQELTESELQIMEAQRFVRHYKDSVFYLNTIQEYTAEILIQESRAKLERKFTRLKKAFKGNSEALDYLSELEVN